MLIGNQSNSPFKVDGDTDSPTVQREFEKVIKEHIQKAEEAAAPGKEAEPGGVARSLVPGNLFDRSERRGKQMESKQAEEEQDAIVHDLEETSSSPVKKSVQTISHHVSLANGHLKRKGVTMANGVGPAAGVSQQQQNGHIPNGRPNFRNMLEEADNYPIHSYM